MANFTIVVETTNNLMSYNRKDSLEANAKYEEQVTKALTTIGRRTISLYEGNENGLLISRVVIKKVK